MGARQSHLYIFLESKDDKYGQVIDENTRYDVTSTKGVLQECDGFEVVTHEITLRKPNDMSFDIYIYDTKREVSKTSYIFAYCSPGHSTHVAKKVKAYYSVLSPHNPLVISFHRDHDDFNCPIDELRSAGWDWASNISAHSSNKGLVELLKEQYKNLGRNRTIHFITGTENKNVMGRKQEIGNDINYRLIFVPDESGSILGLQCLYCLDSDTYKVKCDNPPPPEKTQIDPYYLTDILNKYYAGIVLYFYRNNGKPQNVSQEKDHENMLLLAEFSNPCETISLKRKDKDGCWWVREKFTYNDHKGRVEGLKKIKEGAESNKLNTVILEKDSNYICGREVKSETTLDTYNKYTHQFKEASEPNLLFGRTKITIDTLNPSDIKAKTIEVYYLKASGKKDEKPFLIVFINDETPEKKKAYHFNNKTEFKDWVEFKEVQKLEQKLERISNEGKCTEELRLLRPLVHKILTTDETSPKEPPPEQPEPPRPDLYPEEPKPPEPLPLGWIITGSVGGTVFIIGSTVGYGVYWYNTTIRLLT